jgi:hypothetical protein
MRRAVLSFTKETILSQMFSVAAFRKGNGVSGL